MSGAYKWNYVWGLTPLETVTIPQSALQFQPFTKPKEQKTMDKKTTDELVEELVTVTAAKATLIQLFSTLNNDQKSELRDWFENESFNW